ncbi:2-hydroxyacid dehydrogenase [Pseudolabrys sp. FHR47]|uniref:2-hydroxyacid dehydrogenase n=1 Tax=Pseudolabrys sp. FHR47 TaxID=2562284 RepID=UPI0010BE5E2C|nr:2-hydroxyacid dehydrogenase [Pseudolabrys sp. FHR47]
MTDRSDKPRVAMLGALAPDLRAGLAERLDLVAPDQLPQLPAAERGGIKGAVTMAMQGAPEALLDLLPSLTTLASCGAGLEKFDEPALKARGIALYPTPHVMTEDTADMAVALVYAVARDIVAGDAYVRSGRWKNGRRSRATRVAGKRAGIVGLGRIGRAVADRLAGVGLNVSYHGPRPKSGLLYHYVADIVALAAAVDFLVMTCPGDETTRHIVNRDVLRALGPSGFLINVSRGTVVDEEALLEALENKTIAGAGLDVFAQEPVPNSRFLALSNVVLQPHASVLTHDNLRELVDEVCRILGASAQ